jgi:hypothetical protein
MAEMRGRGGLISSKFSDFQIFAGGLLMKFDFRKSTNLKIYMIACFNNKMYSLFEKESSKNYPKKYFQIKIKILC